MRVKNTMGCYVIHMCDAVYISFRDTIFRIEENFVHIQYKKSLITFNINNNYFDMFINFYDPSDNAKKINTHIDLKSKKSLGRFISSQNIHSTEDDILFDEICVKSLLKNITSTPNMFNINISLTKLLENLHTNGIFPINTITAISDLTFFY